MDVKSRSRLTIFFDAWLTHYNDQKTAWHKMIKVRFLLQKIKMNRVFAALKKYTRHRQTHLLQQTIIEEKWNSLIQKRIMVKWRKRLQSHRQAIGMIHCVYIENAARGFIRLIQHQNQVLKNQERIMAKAMSYWKNNDEQMAQDLFR